MKRTDWYNLVLVAVVLLVALVLVPKLFASVAQDAEATTLRLVVRDMEGIGIENALCYLLIGDEATRGYTDPSGLIMWTVPSSFEYRIVVAPLDPNTVLGFSSTYLREQNGDMAILEVPGNVAQIAVVCVVGLEIMPTPTPAPTRSLEQRATELKAFAWEELGMELRVCVEVGE